MGEERRGERRGKERRRDDREERAQRSIYLTNNKYSSWTFFIVIFLLKLWH